MEFNRAAEQMFGRTAEEARTRAASWDQLREQHRPPCAGRGDRQGTLLGAGSS